MRCPYCKVEVGSDDVFCGDCGKPLPRAPKEERRTRAPLIVGILAIVAVGCVIGGVVIVTLGGRMLSVLPDLSPTPSQIATSTPIPTSILPPTPSVTWLTYDGVELGISLEYPQAWLVNEDLGVPQVVFAEKEEDLAVDAFLLGTSFIVLLSPTDDLDLQSPQEALQYATEFLRQTYAEVEVGEIEPRRIAGHDGAWVTIDGEFERQSVRLKGWLASMVVHDYVYLLSGAAPIEDWSYQQPILATMLDSVRISEPYHPTVLPTPSPRPSPTPAQAPGADGYEPDDSLAQARPIATDGTRQSHNLHIEGDRDYVYFDADEATGYTIETLNLGSDIDTIIYLYDGEENEIAYDDDGAEESLASRLTWVAPESGTHYVMIRDLGDDSAGSSATYEISVVSTDAIEGADSYEPDDSFARANSIATDGTYQTHTFHVTADLDYVSFSAQEGVEYTIETGDLEGECDTEIYLYDEDGTELDYDDDGADESVASRLVWTAPSSGTYYVLIEEYQGRAGPDVGYRIWVTR